jgi:TonB-linked SusC/RagA family outer membrane protein
MKLKLNLLALFVLFGLYASSQNQLVTGKVINDSTREPLSGVTITLKGTGSATSTNAEGQYSISAPSKNSVLVFTSVGLKPEERNVGNKTVIDVTLSSEISTLNDVVVVGYQTVQRRDLTASVSSVGAKQLKDIPVNSAAQALAGRLAGVQVTGTEGTPNAEFQIRVRGGGSITQDNSPLYVIDGVQVENGLNAISPQDIESVDVLKDASATAIYGARGANGVVIITTKRGRNGRTSISYNGFMGYRKLIHGLDVMMPYDFVMYQYQRSRGSGTDSTNFARKYGTTWDTLSKYKDVPFTDWQNEMFGRSAMMQTHNISLSGGNVNTQHNLSLASNKEEGILQSSGFDRKLVSFNFDHTFSKKLKVSFSTRYNNTHTNGAGTSNPGSFTSNALRQAIKYRPFLLNGQGLDDYDPEYDAATSSAGLNLKNPILLDNARYRSNLSSLINISGSINYSFTDYLSFKSTLGYDYNTARQDNFDDTLAASIGSGGPLATISNSTRGTFTNSNVLNYTNALSPSSFAKNNRISILVGHEVYENDVKSYKLDTRNFPLGITADKALGNMGLGTAFPSSSLENTERILSLFSRVNYTYSNKYYASFSVRGDGSTKFIKGKQWGYFPSASLAWRISNESFMSSLKPTLNDLKLRVSYGQAGNNRIGNFLYKTLFVPTAFYNLNDIITSAYNPASLANPSLKWETTISRNLGLDAGFFNSRLTLSADVYKNTTKDLLVDVAISPTNGYLSQIANVGSTSNTGVELQIGGTPIQNKDFSWTANFNISFNKNKVISLGDYQKFFLTSSGWAGSGNPADYIVKVGEQVGTMWGLINDGYYTLNDFDYNPTTTIYSLKAGVPNASGITSIIPQPGGIKFKDINGDTLITDADRTTLGNANPKFFGGLNQQFTYKNFDLSVFINFQYGNKVFNANRLEFTSGYTTDANLLASMNDRWKTYDENGVVVQRLATIGGVQRVVGAAPEVLARINQNAKIWMPITSGGSFYSNSYAVEDGSFIRINNLTLGYTLPASLVKRAKIERLRFYFTGNNLGIITNYSGYDPEVSTRRGTPLTPGVDYSAYPRSSSYIVGLNLTF